VEDTDQTSGSPQDPSGLLRFLDPPASLPEGVAEVYGWYGYAVAMAQLVERSLAVLLHIQDRSTEFTDVAITRAFEGRDSKTLGKLLSDLRSSGASTSDAVDRFLPFVAKRNELVHGYFTRGERQQKMGNDLGRAQLVAELREVATEGRNLAIIFGVGGLLIGASRGYRERAPTPPSPDL
jgi:hypothetical protein